MYQPNLVLQISFLLALSGAILFAISANSQLTIGAATRKFARAQAFKIRDYSEVAARLKQLGKDQNYLDFRSGQLLNAGTGFISGYLITLLFSGKTLIALMVGGILCSSIFFLMDRSLSRDLEKARVQLESEFPAIVELMSLALSAGETPAQAMFRISERSSGLLAKQFSQAVEAIRLGTPFHIALDDMGRRINSIVIRRFIDAMVTAVVRGAPLVDVLQRHALESRQSHKNAVMAKAGKAEISMMIPIVFLILPISILFALWPSLSTLNIFST